DSPTTHWAVVGGGMMGLAAALKLLQRGQRVTLLEAAPELGGLASAWQLGDVEWDKFYHVILLSDSRLRSLLSELELDQEIEWVQTKTGFYSDNRLYSLSSSLDFLRFPPLNLYQKFRLGST
ncbi:MAG: FAD-dependent oxidoreductase, partial [Pirellulaceae bacterium]